MSSVFDDRQLVLPGYLENCVHLARMAVQVNRKDGFDRRVDTYRRFKLFRVDVQGVLLYVDQHRLRPDVLDDMDAGGERHRCADHLVARADAQRREGNMKSRGAGVQGQGRRRADEGLEVGLETFHARPGGDPPRTQALHDSFDFLLADQRWREAQELLPHLPELTIKPTRCVRNTGTADKAG